MKQFDEHGSNLIFLISQPGPEASVLQRLLSRHPSVHSVPDSWIMLHPLYALKRRGLETDFDAHRARSALDSFLSRLPGNEGDYVSALRAMAKVLYERALFNSGKSIFLDNTPRYYHVLAELRQVFPAAKFVFLLRNPLMALAYTIKSLPGSDIARLRETPEYTDLMKAPVAIHAALRTWGNDATLVPYEQLVTAPQETVKALCLKLGLQYDPVLATVDPSEVEDGMAGGGSLPDTLMAWTADLAGPAWRCFAQDYLQTLGEPLITDFGYSYSKLQASLGGRPSARAEMPAAKSPAALNEEGERLFACGDIDTAMECFQAALRIDGSDPLTLNNLAVLHWQRGNLLEALGCLAKGMEMSPDNRELVTNGAQILCAAERPADALALCRSYLQDYPQDEGVREIAQALEAQYGVAACASRIVDAVEDNQVANRASSAPALNQLGERHFAAGDLAAAQQAFEQALTVNPRDVDVLNNLGVVCWHQGDTGPALNFLSRALELQPDGRDAVLNCASVLNALGNSRESRMLCENYLGKHPDDEQIRAILLELDGNTRQARSSIEGLNAEGERLFGEGDIEGAKAAFLDACALDAANGTTCNNLGVLFWHGANLDQALLYLGRAMEAEPDNPVFVNNSIQMLIDNGREQDALRIRASFIHDHPEHAGSVTETRALRNAVVG
jgi:tetratricopeptide (TPR) repeat protein